MPIARVIDLTFSRSPFQIFYTHAVAAVIVYDVTSRETFDSVLKWKQDIDAKVFLPSGAKIPVLLLGNKSDLLTGEAPQQPCVTPEDLKRFVEQHGFFAASGDNTHHTRGRGRGRGGIHWLHLVRLLEFPHLIHLVPATDILSIAYRIVCWYLTLSFGASFSSLLFSPSVPSAVPRPARM